MVVLWLSHIWSDSVNLGNLAVYDPVINTIWLEKMKNDICRILHIDNLLQMKISWQNAVPKCAKVTSTSDTKQSSTKVLYGA
jgi:hypothetical protein